VGPRALLGYAVYAWAPSVRRRRYLRRISPFLAREAGVGSALAALDEVFDRRDGRTAFELEVEGIGLPALLRYEDRNSMTFSIESRLPYLDPRLLDLAYALPSWLKIRRGWSKAIVRRALEGVVPSDVLWSRQKIGFAAPQGDFMRDLVPLVEDVFGGTATCSASLIDPGAVRRACREGEDRTAQLWRFLNLELWMRAFRLEA